MPVRRILLLTLSLALGFAASSVRAQDPKGSELRINPRTAGVQWLPDVATAADGHFVVVWREGDGGPDLTEPVFVMARLFNATGSPRGGEIRVARLTARRAANLFVAEPAVAMAPDGRFVVVWQGGTEDPSIGFGRRFAADGRPLGQRFRLARSTVHSQLEPDVAMASDGSFVAVWGQEDGGIAQVNLDVFFRRFGADGRSLGPEALAIGGHRQQSRPHVAMRPNGDFVVVSETFSGEGGGFDIAAQVFSRSGIPAGDEFLLVNDEGVTGRDGVQTDPAVAVTPDGRFAVAWFDSNADLRRAPNLEGNDHFGIAIRFYAPDGVALAPAHAVNVFLRGFQVDPAVSALQTGGFLVTWTSGAGQDGDAFGIFARVYGADGRPRGREFRINLLRTGSQTSPALAIAPNGQGAVVWNGPDGDGGGIFARRMGKPQ